MKRREFVQWGVAVGAAASKTLFAQAPATREYMRTISAHPHHAVVSSS